MLHLGSVPLHGGFMYAGVVLLWGRCTMHFRFHRHVLRVPVVVSVVLVTFVYRPRPPEA